jgi:hypothetical protein
MVHQRMQPLLPLLLPVMQPPAAAAAVWCVVTP